MEQHYMVPVIMSLFIYRRQQLLIPKPARFSLTKSTAIPNTIYLQTIKNLAGYRSSSIQ
jgi:hypothetical protein